MPGFGLRQAGTSVKELYTMPIKHLILIGDGMADYPLSQLEGRTPLEAAHIPNLDSLAQTGCLGLVQTIPPDFSPGSDVANLTVLGYPAAEFYTGRAPLEAANMGVNLGPEDVAFRCNLVTLAGDESQRRMEDFSAGHIDTATAHQLIKALNEQLGSEQVHFYPGVSYRHLMIWKRGTIEVNCTPPHDITGQAIEPYLPQGQGADFLIELMTRSQSILANQQANSIWLWGQGKAPQLPSLQERYQLKGALISAVDLLKGIGKYLGMTIINVPGATGYLDTNYEGKAQAALEALAEHDFVYLHLEAPDEAAHNGDIQAKIEAIEAFDQRIVGPVWEQLKKQGNYRLLVMPDHATPISLKTHSREPVPFVLYPAGSRGKNGTDYNEQAARATGCLVEDGCQLIHWLLER